MSLTKSSAGILSPEIWRYGNNLTNSLALCGEYHFMGYRADNMIVHSNSADGLQRVAEELQAFAHVQTLRLIAEVGGVAGRVAPSFLAPNALSDIDMRTNIALISKELQSRTDEQIRNSGILVQQVAGQIIDQNVSEGWLSAANIIPQMMRLQEGYGELVAHALPEAVEPLLSHPIPAREEILRTMGGSYEGEASAGHPNNWLSSYSQLAHTISIMRQWINDTQLPAGTYLSASGLDLRDHLTMSTDSALAFGMYAASIDHAALVEGVWGSSGDKNGGAWLFSDSLGLANPFAALAEFGQRQYRLGLYLLGMSGSGLTTAGAIAPAMLVGLVALALLGGGLGLIFVIPFIPFVRFLIAALIWILNVFEAVLAMPIVALAHLNPTGDGISGSAAKEAYRLWLALMIRPLLTLAGLVVGFLMLEVGLGLVTAALSSFAGDGAVGNSSMMIIANLALVLMFDIFTYVVTNAAFKGITWLPDQALRWFSPFVATEGRTIQMVSNGGVVPCAAAPSVSALAAVSNTIAAPGGAMVNVRATSSAATNASAESQTHGLKVALFPSHSDKQSTLPEAGALPTQPPSVHSSTTLTEMQLGSKNKSLKPENRTKNIATPAFQQDEKSQDEEKNNKNDGEKKDEGKKDQTEISPDSTSR